MGMRTILNQKKAELSIDNKVEKDYMKTAQAIPIPRTVPAAACG